MYYDLPPSYIWSVRGGSSKTSAGEQHSMRMTAVLRVRADGTKLPLMFVMRVVLLDNLECHVSDESYKIMYEELRAHLCPMTPISTSVYQPLDVGVMAPFKRNLRNLWLLEEQIVGDDEDPFSPTACQKRMAMVKRAIAAWDMV
ncbi:hypothetical protein DYB28_000087 [Aphanomyces astaci]|uniref:DDE-1 domain-containing protein n=1 Tax=Aphanomyces astaci TaxID=112090 RepID=A0A3L6VN16_APHAT|nr:hypothetical protein DYB26_004715 [Aphanomyces astaci]RLO10272.1 hypothetical protein DYB28_000087 [Aphanomyces astaci]